MPPAPVDRSRKLLIRVLDCQTPSCAFTLRELGSFFQEVPARLGQHVALDAVIDCLITSFARQYVPELVLEDDNARQTSELVAYGTAIKALRHALAEPWARSSEETLCAALSLFIYEFFLERPTVQCITLAGGASSILRSWGPSRIKSKFALALFDSHYHTIISHAMVFGTECFLAEPGWDKVFRDCPTISTEERALWTTVARIPNFVQAARQCLSGDCLDREAVMARGRHLRRLVLALESYMTGDLSSREVFHFAPELYTGSNLEGTFDCTVCTDQTHELISKIVYIRASLLMINGALRRLGDADDEKLREERRCTDWICTTAPIAARLGMQKGSFITLGGAAAFGLASEKQRRILAGSTATVVGKIVYPQVLTQEEYCKTYLGLHRMYEIMTGSVPVGYPWSAGPQKVDGDEVPLF